MVSDRNSSFRDEGLAQSSTWRQLLLRCPPHARYATPITFILSVWTPVEVWRFWKHLIQVLACVGGTTWPRLCVRVCTCAQMHEASGYDHLEQQNIFIQL